MFVLWKMAFRNLFSHKIKTLIVGAILVLASFLAVLGGSFIDAISNGMQKSLTNSLTGDIQIYSANAKDKFSIFGDEHGTEPDISYVNDYKKIKETLLRESINIKNVVPMGINFAMLNPGNLLDVKLDELRNSYKNKNENIKKDELIDQIKLITLNINSDIDKNLSYLIMGNKSELKDAKKNLAIVINKEFWKNFNSLHEEKIEFLANKIAPLIIDDNMLYMNYMGTIPALFESSFSQFEIVKGERIPEGMRGFLFTDYYYENEVKHRIARRLDQIKKSMEKDGESIAKTKTLKDKVNSNIAQSSEIYSQLAPGPAIEIKKKLQILLKSSDEDLKILLNDFLSMDDRNFISRYNFFYKEIAPHIILYKIKVGDVFPLTSYSKRGTSHSLNMKVYGTYRFKSFENSPIANGFNLVDLASFRDLYGLITAERKEENIELEKEMALSDFDMKSDKSMFKKGNIDEKKDASLLKKISEAVFAGNVKDKQNIFERKMTRDEIESGVFLNAAIVLKDKNKIAETMKQINEISRKFNLDIQTTDWKSAAGIVGQLITVISALLYLFILIILLVAIFIIMNAMIMGMLDRQKEIGTMRAIGAQKSFVLSMLFWETFIQGMLFSTLGALLAVIVIKIVGTYGIPAWSDVATFFFSGSRLYLSVNLFHIVGAIFMVIIVSVLSALYPVFKATRIPPITAMGKAY